MKNNFKVGGFARIISDTGMGEVVRILSIERTGVVTNLKYLTVSEYFKLFINVEAMTDEEAMLYFLERD